VSFSETEWYQIARLRDRLKTVEVRLAFAHLISWAERSPLSVHPISRGAFSAIHLSTRPEARPYADCEFAFKGAADHMRWYFRKPGLESGLVESGAVARRFKHLLKEKAGEITTDIRDVNDAKQVIAYVEGCLVGRKDI